MASATVADVHEIPFHGLAIWIEHEGTAPLLTYSAARTGPTRSRHRGPEHIFPNDKEYLKSSFSMIHGARRHIRSGRTG